MQPYNVEIFGKDFSFKQHYNSGRISYKYDYISPVENTITIAHDPNVSKGDYIRIVNDEEEFFGIIKGITVGGKTNEISKIKFAPFESVFKEEILFDTTLQGSDKTLEEMIAMYIAEYWINNADAVQNIPGLEVETISSTTDWGFHLTSDVKGLNKTIINFMSVIIKRSLTKYQVGLYIEPNFKEKKICVKIGRKNTSVFRIETHLPNVIKKNIVLNETTEDVNKLILYSSENLEDCVIYYKHPDKTVDTINENRIIPVIYDIQTVAVREDETFEESAKAMAAKVFDTESYNNLIEITVLNDDDLVNAKKISIGQEVLVISNNNEYSSILTGYEKGAKTKLIFGTIRLELTKILKGEQNDQSWNHRLRFCRWSLEGLAGAEHQGVQDFCQ